jgi:hypothetical protein
MAFWKTVDGRIEPCDSFGLPTLAALLFHLIDLLPAFTRAVNCCEVLFILLDLHRKTFAMSRIQRSDWQSRLTPRRSTHRKGSCWAWVKSIHRTGEKTLMLAKHFELRFVGLLPILALLLVIMTWLHCFPFTKEWGSPAGASYQ